MTRQICFVAMMACLAVWAAHAGAADRVKMAAGNQSAGTITGISPTELVVELGSTKRTFPVNEIEAVTFDDEPNDLTQARFAVAAGRYDDAIALLDKINTRDIVREAIASDVEFYKGIAAARMALAGNGSIPDAGRQLVAFERDHKSSYHYFEVCEVLGDLLAALGKAEQAEAFYNKLATAPWPEFQLRAGVLVGRALVGQQKHEQAIARFDQVLTAGATGPEADRQKLAASLGKASALAGAGNTDQAISSIEEIIAKADPENQELHARAYNVLGNCYKAAGKKQDALLAFLHVDLLYARYAEQHAEALANLATLFAEDNKAERAAAARSLLKEKYPHSAWAQK